MGVEHVLSVILQALQLEQSLRSLVSSTCALLPVTHSHLPLQQYFLIAQDHRQANEPRVQRMTCPQHTGDMLCLSLPHMK